MYQFIADNEGVRADLAAAKVRDVLAYGHLLVLIQELRGHPPSVEAFVTEAYEDARIREVKPIGSLQRKRINGLTVKIWDVPSYRLIFAVDHSRKKAGLLAVMHRSQDYETDTVLWDRIERAYDGLGFQRY